MWEIALAKQRVSLIERWRLAGQRAGHGVGRPSLRKLLREGSYPFSPISRRIRSRPVIQKTGNPRNVLLLPGFLASPMTMGYLARQIEKAGHDARHWSLGFNFGPTPDRLEALDRQIDDLQRDGVGHLVLIGWSLGGLFARELAKRHPEAVSKVITLGSPFSGDRRSNNAWRLYQFVAGHPVDALPLNLRVEEKPPVETVAFWSPRDGVIAPRSACGKPGERDRAVAVRCTHMGFSYDPRAIEAILRELERR